MCELLVIKDLNYGLSTVKGRKGYKKEMVLNKWAQIMSEASKTERIVFVGQALSTVNIKDIKNFMMDLKTFTYKPVVLLDHTQVNLSQPLELLVAIGVVKVVAPGQSWTVDGVELHNGLSHAEKRMTEGFVFCKGEVEGIKGVDMIEISRFDGVLRKSPGDSSSIYRLLLDSEGVALDAIELETVECEFEHVRHPGGEVQEIDMSWLMRKNLPEEKAGTITDKVGAMIKEVEASDSVKSILLSLNTSNASLTH